MGQTSKTKPKQDWVPTEPAFRRFLEWLDEGQDSNGERYLEMRRRLVRYFDHKRAARWPRLKWTMLPAVRSATSTAAGCLRILRVSKGSDS
jgi:hypothetical protein